MKYKICRIGRNVSLLLTLILVQKQFVRETFAGEEHKKIVDIVLKIKAVQGMFNWFKILWGLNDDKLIEINGIDYTLYLIFLRYAAVFFGLLTMFNLVCMIPIYATGNYDHS